MEGFSVCGRHLRLGGPASGMMGTGSWRDAARAEPNRSGLGVPLQPDWDTRVAHRLLRFRNRELAEMKNAGCQRRIRFAF